MSMKTANATRMGSGERRLGTESSPVIVLKGGCSILFALIHDAGLLPRILPRSITGGDGVGDDGLDYKKLSISLGYCAGIQLPSLGFQFSDVEFLGEKKGEYAISNITPGRKE